MYNISEGGEVGLHRIITVVDYRDNILLLLLHFFSFRSARVMFAYHHKRRSVSPSISWQFAGTDYHCNASSSVVPCRTRRPQRSSSVLATPAACSVPPARSPESLLLAPDGTAALLIYQKICACHFSEYPTK